MLFTYGLGKLTSNCESQEASRPAARPVPLSWLGGKDNSTGEASLVLGHDVRIPADTAKGVKTSPLAPFVRKQTCSLSLCPSRYAPCSLTDEESTACVQHGGH